MSVLITGGQVKTIIVMNTANLSITNYNNYDFTSYAKFAGQYFGANENGLYLLEGDDDIGTPITSTIRTVLHGFKTTLLKRIVSCYIGLRRLDGTVPSPASMTVKSVNESDVAGTARTLSTTSSNNSKVKRVKFAKGPRNSYWGVEIANVSGVDFTIDSVEIDVVATARRMR